MKKYFIFSLIIMIVLVILLTNVNQVVAPIKDTVRDLVQPDPLVMLPDPVVVIQKIQKLSRLETASIFVERKIRGFKDNERLFGIFGETILFVAYGEVIAGVDFDFIEEEDIQIQGNTVQIHLPSAEIFRVILDNDKSYVAYRGKGILAQYDPQLERRVRNFALSEMKKIAIEVGILNSAAENAQLTVKSLISQLGFDAVVFI